MSLQSVAKFKASGVISIYRVYSNNTQLLLTRKNAVLPNASNLIALIMSGDASAAISQITLLLGASTKATGVISNKVYDSEENSVEFSATFSENSFTGNVDNAVLGPSDPITLGNFSEANFAAVSKTNIQMLSVSWKITFQIAN